jgi:phosphatidylglycerophosphatase A
MAFVGILFNDQITEVIGSIIVYIQLYFFIPFILYGIYKTVKQNKRKKFK